jgi:hypothetical protein
MWNYAEHTGIFVMVPDHGVSLQCLQWSHQWPPLWRALVNQLTIIPLKYYKQCTIHKHLRQQNENLAKVLMYELSALGLSAFAATVLTLILVNRRCFQPHVLFPISNCSTLPLPHPPLQSQKFLKILQIHPISKYINMPDFKHLSTVR